jgi:ankyrin repeat protein
MLNVNSTRILVKMIGIALVLAFCPCTYGADDKDKALLEACKSGNLGEAQRLIDQGANVNAKDKNRITPLMIACGYQGQIKAQDKSAKTSVPIPVTAHPKLAALLIEKGANVNVQDDFGVTPLMAACGYVRLARGVDAQKMIFLPANTETVKLLLEKGADLNAKDRDGVTPLLAAVGFKQSFQFTEGTMRITRIISRPGNPAAVQILLGKGANPSAKEKFGLTPLLVASIWNDMESIPALLEKGAKVNEKDKASKTPLLWAAENGRLESVRLLLEKKADIQINDVDGMTALMRAAFNGHTQVVQLLLQEGSNLNKRCKKGRTALIVAAENGHPETVKVLVEKGADIKAKDNSGRTALACAQKKKYDKVVELLKKQDKSK